jgi:hypothetical protein
LAEKTILPADVMHGNATVEEADFAIGGLDFRDKLVKISAFIGGLLFFAAIVLMMKFIIRR